MQHQMRFLFLKVMFETNLLDHKWQQYLFLLHSISGKSNTMISTNTMYIYIYIFIYIYNTDTITNILSTESKLQLVGKWIHEQLRLWCHLCSLDNHTMQTLLLFCYCSWDSFVLNVEKKLDHHLNFPLLCHILC